MAELTRRVAARLVILGVVSAFVVAGCGDEFREVWIRNDTGTSFLVAIIDQEVGDLTVVAVGPGDGGVALSRPGTVTKVTMRLLDHDCEELFYLQAEGGNFGVVIKEPAILELEYEAPVDIVEDDAREVRACGGH